MLDIQVRFVGNPWPNHSDHSGYHQLVSRLGTSVPMPDISNFHGTWLPGRLAVAMARRSGVRHYGYEAFYHEWAAAREILRRQEPTVYHVLYGDQSYRYLGHVRRFGRATVIASFHLPPKRLEDSFSTASHLAALDAAIVVGSNQLSYFSGRIEPERLHLLPHGVDTITFRPGDGLPAVPGNGKQCLFVGMHDRDFETLSAMINLVSRRDPHVRFVVVTSPDMEQMFEGRTNVDFHSGISEEALIDVYQRSDILVQPLLDCTANNAILEGLACGLPVVASDVGAITDYVSNECAILTAKGDPGDMAQSVITLLGDDDRRLTMAASARQQAVGFDWDVIADRLRAIYKQLYQPSNTEQVSTSGNR